MGYTCNLSINMVTWSFLELVTGGVRVSRLIEVYPTIKRCRYSPTHQSTPVMQSCILCRHQHQAWPSPSHVNVRSNENSMHATQMLKRKSAPHDNATFSQDPRVIFFLRSTPNSSNLAQALLMSEESDPSDGRSSKPSSVCSEPSVPA